MASDDRSHRDALKALKKAQEKHKVLVAKVEKTRAKLEKRAQKLSALEAQIAQLERAAAEPDKRRLGQAAGGEKNLRRARLIFNPDSGGNRADNGKRLTEMVATLREHGIIAGIGLKTSGKAARELAREAVDNGEELVIVAGGDGTIEDVAAQLVGSKTTLGILPLGSMNNVARCLGVPLSLQEACELIAMEVTRPIDIGRVLSNDKPDVEYFLEGAGVGLSAVLLPAGQALEKGRWAALPLALRKLFDVKPEPIAIELDDQAPIRAYSQIITVSNAPMMGRNIMIAPDAKMDDGFLDVAVFNEMTKTELLQYFMTASNGSRAENPKIQYYRAQRVRIHSNQDLEVNSDKDLIQAKRVLEIGIVPQALSVIVGKGFALSLPVQAVPAVPPLSGPEPETPTNGNEKVKQAEGVH
jgi:diacylglycerol kinase (ATP)